jgi:hypothetical protein
MTTGRGTPSSQRITLRLKRTLPLRHTAPLAGADSFVLEIVFFSDGPLFRVAQFDHADCG